MRNTQIIRNCTWIRITILFIIGVSSRSHAFAPVCFLSKITTFPISHGSGIISSTDSSTIVFAAAAASAGGGFGNPSSKKNKKGGAGGLAKNADKSVASTTSSSLSSLSLKPKAQWDRFKDLKQCTALKVGVRKVTNNSNSEWLEVGRIRAKDDTLSGQIAALVLQRGLIAEHSKRLYPLQIQTKDKLEWGYYQPTATTTTDDAASTDDGGDTHGEWVAIENVKSIHVEGVEAKNIGFEGTPDPASGYYCFYDNSASRKGTKVLNLESDKGEPNSKGARAL